MRLVCGWAVVVAVGLSAGIGCSGDDDDDGDDADDGGEPDAGTGPFLLVGRTPDRGAVNVWVHDPIILEFSHPLDPGTVGQDSISLRAGERTLDFEIGLSADRRTLTARLSEPLVTPAEVTIAVAESIRDESGEAFAGDMWVYDVPVWQRIAARPAGTAVRPALAAGGGAVVGAWVGAAGSAAVYSLELGGWRQLGGALGGDVSDLRLAVGGDGVPVLAWREAASGYVSRFDGTDWVALGGGLPAPAGSPSDLAVGADGQPVVAAVVGAFATVRAWNGSSFEELGPTLPVPDATTELALALDGAAPVVALVSGGRLTASRLQGGAWVTLGGPIDAAGASAVDLVARAGQIAVAWQKLDLEGTHVLASSISADNVAAWRPVAAAADLDIQDEAGRPSIAIAPDGAIHLAWEERGAGAQRILVARASGGGWEFLDSALAADGDAAAPALAVDSRGVPSAVWLENGGLAAARWNDSPILRQGLIARLPAGSCAIPVDPPARLADTGCYADVAGHQVAPQLVPFSINSPLWSDGALKRRFLLVPDGAAVNATQQGAWQMPVGTIVVKEFWLERQRRVGAGTERFPVETRFLVKRCEEGECGEPWQGYSYRWNPEGTEADLLNGDAELRVLWPVVSRDGQETLHTHIYPGRQQCVRCHNQAAGRVLGLQTAQLDRPTEFGEVIDNQLRSMTAIGLVSSTGAGAGRLPSSLDPSYTLEARARAYFHANCSHCHRPGGERPTIDFRFESPLAANNICDRLTVGDHVTSTIYLRDSTRGAGQMPPLATDLVDSAQLRVTASWIDLMTSCP